MAEDYEGGCLCGQVRYRVRGPFQQFHLCHCSRCRRSTGSAHASNLFTAADAITWLSGEQQVQRFDLPEAQRFARCFCRTCGSGVPCLSRDGRLLIVPAGSLDTDPRIQPMDNIFWQDRAGWYDAALAAPRFAAYPQ